MYPLPHGIPDFDLPQHRYHTTMKQCNVTDLFEVAGKAPGAGGSQSILLAQEKDISYQTYFFLLGVVFSERMKQTKLCQHHLSFCDLKRNFALLPRNFKRLRGFASPGDILTALSSRNPPPSECFLASFIRNNHHLLTVEILGSLEYFGPSSSAGYSPWVFMHESMAKRGSRQELFCHSALQQYPGSKTKLIKANVIKL